MSFEPITTISEREAIEKLISTECYCGATKVSRRSHCRSCYYRLPPRVRQSLYNRVGSGYEAAFIESCQILAERHTAKAG